MTNILITNRDQHPQKPLNSNFEPNLSFFSNFSPPYWIYHFQFRKSNSKIFIIDIKNPWIKILSKMLPSNYGPPFWISKVWWQDRNQRPRKPLYSNFQSNLSFLRIFNGYTGSAICNFESPIKKILSSVLENPCIRILSKI